MKPRYIITVAALIPLLGAALFMYGKADAPTFATNMATLAKHTLSEGLPALWKPGNPAEDAGVYYEQMLALIAKHPDVLTRTREHDELVDELCQLLLRAADAGSVQDGFMDKHIPVQMGAPPDYGEAIESINVWIMYRSAELYRDNKHGQARDLALAIWVFGHRLFEDNTRLYTRNTGLDLMESAGGLLYQMSADDPQGPGKDEIGAWMSAIDKLRRAWQHKLEVSMVHKPHHGDLLNIALNDQDRTFRVEATLRLGIFRYEANRGTRRAMNRAIQSAIVSDDPLLAEAGRAADALTLEQKRRLY